VANVHHRLKQSVALILGDVEYWFCIATDKNY
jgi:hypothetical protein